MKKLIDVTLPIIGYIVVPVEAETDDDAMEIAFERAKLDCIHDFDGEGAVLFIEGDGSTIGLMDSGDQSGSSCREVEIKD